MAEGKAGISFSSGIPVLARADALVIGGSFAGSACALSLAQKGMKVVVAESSTCLGREMTSTNRYWIDGPPLKLELAEQWLGPARKGNGRGGISPLVPDLVKRGIEDALLNAGVEIFYGMSPVGRVVARDINQGAVLAGKGGPACVISPIIVDATEWASFGRMCWNGFILQKLPAKLGATRILEFTGTHGITFGRIEVGAVEGMTGTSVVARPGHAGDGHVLVEYEINASLDEAGHLARERLESQARETGERLSDKLAAGIKGFSGSWLASSSPRLRLLSPWSVPPSSRPFVLPDNAGIFVLSTASGMAGDQERLAMLEPGFSAESGLELAKSLGITASAGIPDGMRKALIGFPHAGPAGSMHEIRFIHHDNSETVEPVSALIPEHPRADVLVVGGGTAGVVAAAASARMGARTVLLEMNHAPGGAGTLGCVDSYWFGNRWGFTAEMDRRYLEAAGPVPFSGEGKWNIEARIRAQSAWLEDAKAGFISNCTVFGSIMDGNSVVGAVAATDDGPVAFMAPVLVDCSGDGDVAAHAGADFTYGSERDGLPMWYSLGNIPQPGIPMNSFTSSLRIDEPRDYSRAVIAGRRRGGGHDHAAYLAPRESRHILGDITLGISDLGLLRKYRDTVCICYSNIDIKGKCSSDHVSWGLLPPNCQIEIPYRALLPRGLEGIIVAGRAYSCTHDFLAAARMQADMQNLGGSAGLAAAMSSIRGCPVRGLPVPDLQMELEKIGALPAGTAGRAIPALIPDGRSINRILGALTGNEPLFTPEDFSECYDHPLDVAILLSAPLESVDLISAEFLRSTGAKRVLLARILAWHGSREGVPVLIDEIGRMISGGKLPAIERSIAWGGTPPDHGLMPEPCYLLFAAGMTRDERVIGVMERIAKLLDPQPADFADEKMAVFCYVDALCSVAERLGSPAALGVLQRLRTIQSLNGLSSRSFEPDYFLERRAYLELAVGRALARCGGREGYQVLASYLNDSRRVLAVHARRELTELCGKDLGGEEPAWQNWLAAQKGNLPPKPWIKKLD